MFWTFLLRNVLRATTACTFSTSQLPKVVREWCVLYILTSKYLWIYNGISYYIQVYAIYIYISIYIYIIYIIYIYISWCIWEIGWISSGRQHGAKKTQGWDFPEDFVRRVRIAESWSLPKHMGFVEGDFCYFPNGNPLTPPWESIKFLGWTMGIYSIISILWCFFVPIFGGPLWCKSKKRIIDPININRCFWNQGAKHRNSWQ